MLSVSVSMSDCSTSLPVSKMRDALMWVAMGISWTSFAVVLPEDRVAVVMHRANGQPRLMTVVKVNGEVEESGREQMLLDREVFNRGRRVAVERCLAMAAKTLLPPNVFLTHRPALLGTDLFVVGWKIHGSLLDSYGW